ncbi:MAG: ImuA family protein [Rhizomicrobium sp.]
MSVAAEKIAILRGTLARAGLGDVPGRARAALGHPGADACLPGGILQGALHEVFPAQGGDEAAAMGFAAALAARAAERKRVLWLRPDFSALEHGEISPLGLLEMGLDPARLLLLRAPDAASVLRAGLDALSCVAIGALVLEIPGAPKLLDFATSRRLVLAAAQSGVTAVLLRLDAQAEPSAAETRWLVRPLRSQAPFARAGKDEWGFPGFDAELVRHRHGRLGHWMMEWRCDDGRFAATDSGAVVSAASHRPAAAQNTSRVA